MSKKYSSITLKSSIDENGKIYHDPHGKANISEYYLSAVKRKHEELLNLDPGKKITTIIPDSGKELTTIIEDNSPKSFLSRLLRAIAIFH